MLTLMFVDYSVEPYYYERGVDLYENGQNYAMASMLHMAGPVLLGEAKFAALDFLFIPFIRINQRQMGITS
ncbi:hypothetical protein RCCS2_09154 [Roseobacter sp. CCS2]|nr:hypothetical protein RCCS2_09154 [Roseobacter sp. CCS2]